MSLKCFVDGYSVSIDNSSDDSSDNSVEINIHLKWFSHDDFQKDIQETLAFLSDNEKRRTVDCPPFNPKEGF